LFFPSFSGGEGEGRGNKAQYLKGPGTEMMGFLEGSYTLDFVGSSFKEKFIEFILMVSGRLFYWLILRPVDYFRSRKKKDRDPKPKNQPV
jgi:hypothetical protein